MAPIGISTLAPGTTVGKWLRKVAGLRWSRDLTPPPPVAFLPGVVTQDVGPAPAAAAAGRAAITIVLPGGSTVSIDPDASPALIKATLRALR